MEARRTCLHWMHCLGAFPTRQTFSWVYGLWSFRWEGREWCMRQRGHVFASVGEHIVHRSISSLLRLSNTYSIDNFSTTGQVDVSYATVDQLGSFGRHVCQVESCSRLPPHTSTTSCCTQSLHIYIHHQGSGNNYYRNRSPNTTVFFDCTWISGRHADNSARISTVTCTVQYPEQWTPSTVFRLRDKRLQIYI